MQKKECKKLINELLLELDKATIYYCDKLNRDNSKESMVAQTFKISYSIIRSEIEMFRDRRLEKVLDKIGGTSVAFR